MTTRGWKTKSLAVSVVFLGMTMAGCLDDGAEQLDEAQDESVVYVRNFGDTQVEVPSQTLDAWGDATVIAVVDGGLNPYHWDWSASFLPQHMDNDPFNDLPLHRPADEWLPGFDSTAFSSFQPVYLSLDEEDGDTAASGLHEVDAEQWSKVQQSTAQADHVVWFPNTKVIAAIDFSGNGIYSSSNAHGAKSASVSTGNLYGTCAECLLVFVNNAGENGMNWVMQQPWIDVVTNSYGFSLVMRDRLYSGSDIVAQKEASERGLHIFFSAGNGQANTFTVPNPTLFSSQEGPDWITTVGAISPGTRASYSGHGKPADVASLGSAYPSQGGDATNGTGTFSGTSSATPISAGTYARALWEARTILPGPSRAQDSGVIAVGDPVECGEKVGDCELGDGVLTAPELRKRFYHGAIHTPAGMGISLVADTVQVQRIDELEFMSEGHGSYFGRIDGDAVWMEEIERIVGPMLGTMEPLERPEGEHEWFVVDSFCRQEIWDLSWDQGYYKAGETSLPDPSPVWPVRTDLQLTCPYLQPPV